MGWALRGFFPHPATGQATDRSVAQPEPDEGTLRFCELRRVLVTEAVPVLEATAGLYPGSRLIETLAFAQVVGGHRKQASRAPGVRDERLLGAHLERFGPTGDRNRALSPDQVTSGGLMEGAAGCCSVEQPMPLGDPDAARLCLQNNHPLSGRTRTRHDLLGRFKEHA